MTKNSENPDNDTTPLERYASVNNLMLETFNKNCTDFKYSHMIKEIQAESWNSSAAEGSRQWTYQTCTEFGYFQSSDLIEQPFGKEFGIDFSIKQCRDIYGTRYITRILSWIFLMLYYFNLLCYVLYRFTQEFIETAIKNTNNKYGGKNIKVSKVIFVNGSIDPWHALGLTAANETTNDNVVIFMDGKKT